MTVEAVRYLRRMRGGSQSHLLLCSDEYFYVVKFQNNPQHVRVLANEYLATRLALSLGLSVPACEIISVPALFVQENNALTIELARTREPCRPGLQFGSRLAGGLMPGRAFDYLTDELLERVTNLNEFAGLLACDKWTSNVDGRQAVFNVFPPRKNFVATFIDQGYCFSAGEWKFSDSPLHGIYGRTIVYRGITGWDSFQPWLERLEKLSPDLIWAIAKEIPTEWYDDKRQELDKLIATLILRRLRVRDLIMQFLMSDRRPFPGWSVRQL